MKIDINPTHIEKGERRICTACPISLATLEALPGGHIVRTYSSWMEITREADQEVDLYRLPFDAVEFVREFDDRKKVKPFSFELADKYKTMTLREYESIRKVVIKEEIEATRPY